MKRRKNLREDVETFLPYEKQVEEKKKRKVQKMPQRLGMNRCD